MRESWRASPLWHLSVAVNGTPQLAQNTWERKEEGERSEKSFENKVNIWGKLRRKAEFLYMEIEPEDGI